MKKLFTIVALLFLLPMIGTGIARAQVTDTLVADVPFDFTVGSTNLPADRYEIRQVGSTMDNLLAIVSREGKMLGVFLVHDGVAKQAPSKPELIFYRVGDRYFLHEVFDAGNRIGGELSKPRAERRLEQEASTASDRGYVTVAAVNGSSLKQ